MSGDLFSGPDRIESRARTAGPGSRPGEPASQGRAAKRAVTVSAANGLVRELLEQSLPPLWIVGEITGWKRYPSGHCYFALRDADSQLRCVMFRGEAQRLPTDPAQGMEVRALGTLTLYEKRGEFQFVVREIEAGGADGLWRLAFDRLRAKLDTEGLLSPERKRPVPRFPATIGVITSPVGAALHDILHVLERRAPWIRVVFAPAKVQGEGAAADVARAIDLVSRQDRVDVIIVGRGGGSVEDLWAFNEEAVARAIASCPVPVISAVGHEVDITIADLVADLRAPTPSAAAELAVPDGRVVKRHLEDLGARLESGLRGQLTDRRTRVARVGERLTRAIRAHVRTPRERLHRLAGMMDALSPLAALARGYAVPLDGDGHLLRNVRQFRPGDAFRLRVVDGSVGCRIESAIPVDPHGNEDG